MKIKIMPAILSVMLILFTAFITISMTDATESDYSKLKPSTSFDKVILIVWDGSQKDATEQLYLENKLPNLEPFISSGTVADFYITDINWTWTDPSHGEMLSGYSPSITGMDGTDPYQILPDNLSIFEKIKSVTPSIKTAAIVSRNSTKSWTNNDTLLKDNYSGISGHGFMGYNFKNAFDSIDYFYDSKSYSKQNNIFYDLLNGSYTNISNNNTIYLVQIDANATELEAEKWINNNANESFFLFVHFGEPDSVGHEYGSGSLQYKYAIIKSDRYTGKLINFLKNESLYNETAIIITTDHGFKLNSTNHMDKPYPYGTSYSYLMFWVSNINLTDGKKAYGYLGDTTPTVLELLGINSSTIFPPYDKSLPIWMRK